MKLFLTALCASFIALPAFAAQCEGGKCGKGDKKKDQGTVMLDDCGKCKKGDKKKEEGTMLAQCDKSKKDEKKKDEGTMLADCGKCEKKDDKDKKKEKGTLV